MSHARWQRGVSLPSGASFNNGTQMFSWTPDFTAASGSPYVATLRASDGLLSSDVNVTIDVLDVPPGPRIVAITDVPNDQGRQVDIHFKRSEYDKTGDGVVLTEYAIYRRIDPIPAPADRLRSPGGPFRAMYPPGDWQYVLTAPARLETDYHVVAPTLADTPNASTFFIAAMTTDPEVFYDGAPASGTSIDNLAPSVPTPFTGAFSGGSTALHWGINTEPDLAFYRLYRGNSGDFVPGPANLIATQSDTGYVDVGAGASYYKLSAVDINGNESGLALLTPQTTIGVWESSPAALWLGLGLPNPARHAATIPFALPRPGRVFLGTYDAGGRLVRELINRELAAGAHFVEWDLRDAEGRRSRSGLYFYRLVSEGRVLGGKLIVVQP